MNRTATILFALSVGVAIGVTGGSRLVNLSAEAQTAAGQALLQAGGQFLEALAQYQQRERRFGRVTEQTERERLRAAR